MEAKTECLISLIEKISTEISEIQVDQSRIDNKYLILKLVDRSNHLNEQVHQIQIEQDRGFS